jgi:hypothetical protein
MSRSQLMKTEYKVQKEGLSSNHLTLSINMITEKFLQVCFEVYSSW